jgi:RP/EB family microtubule-associated protein
MAASRSKASSVGMMEGAFFVSRSELLQWVNALLQINLTKVEQCASGAVYCQIVDSCTPGSVKMSKVNWMAKIDHEFIPNFKVLQEAFDRNKLEKHIDVDKLIRAKYQDNLEFLQWMKAYWEREGSGRHDYDAVKAREGRQLPPWAKPLGIPTQAGPQRSPPTDKENVPSNRELSAQSGQKPRLPARKVEAPSTGIAAKARPASSQKARAPAEDELKSKLQEQAHQIEELREMLEGLEQERDYYFGKLRSVEILCSSLKDQTDEAVDAARVIQDVQSILYAENDDDADEEGAAVAS